MAVPRSFAFFFLQILLKALFAFLFPLFLLRADLRANAYRCRSKRILFLRRIIPEKKKVKKILRRENARKRHKQKGKRKQRRMQSVLFFFSFPARWSVFL